MSWAERPILETIFNFFAKKRGSCLSQCGNRALYTLWLWICFVEDYFRKERSCCIPSILTASVSTHAGLKPLFRAMLWDRILAAAVP